MKVVRIDLTKLVVKLPDPSKSALVEEVKKLGLTDEGEIDLMTSFLIINSLKNIDKLCINLYYTVEWYQQ